MMSSSPVEEESSGLNSVQGTTTTTDPLHAAILDDDAPPEIPPVLDDDPSDNETINIIPEDEECPFAMGDHVYQWCSVAFIPGIYQHHGIVLDVYYHDVEQEWVLKIVDFSNDTRRNSYSNQKKQSLSLYQQSSSYGGAVRTYVCSVEINKKKNGRSSYQSSSSQWQIVQYSATVWQRATWRAGTCTAVRSDPVGLVRARAQFLLEQPDVLPTYDSVQANCECVAVWCKTGTFATLQATSWLATTSASQIKSAVTVGSVAAATQVSVPSAGLWGWLGYTTHVSLLTAQPMLLPAIAAYGVVTASVPAIVLAVAQQQWKTTTVRLNEAFWEQAMAQPDVFAECITYWSTGGDSSSMVQLWSPPIRRNSSGVMADDCDNAKELHATTVAESEWWDNSNVVAAASALECHDATTMAASTNQAEETTSLSSSATNIEPLADPSQDTITERGSELAIKVATAVDDLVNAVAVAPNRTNEELPVIVVGQSSGQTSSEETNNHHPASETALKKR
jgi:hypothetical protein